MEENYEMIIKFKKTVELVRRFEKRKKKDVTISEKAKLEKHYNKLDRFNNIINHWKSRIERLLNCYQEE